VHFRHGLEPVAFRWLDICHMVLVYHGAISNNVGYHQFVLTIPSVTGSQMYLIFSWFIFLWCWYRIRFSLDPNGIFVYYVVLMQVNKNKRKYRVLNQQKVVVQWVECR
jgi:hypothetical protein